MECINCTACMDACDEIMTRIQKPEGLIRYTSIAQLEGRKRRFLRFRTVGYFLLLCVLWLTCGYLLLHKRDLTIRLLRPSGSSFTLDASAAEVVNRFNAKATNKSEKSWVLTPRVPAGYEVVAAFNPWTIPPQSTVENPIFVRRKLQGFPAAGKDKIKLRFFQGNTLAFDTEVTLMGGVQ